VQHKAPDPAIPQPYPLDELAQAIEEFAVIVSSQSDHDALSRHFRERFYSRPLSFKVLEGLDFYARCNVNDPPERFPRPDLTTHTVYQLHPEGCGLQILDLCPSRT
jgi:hypothetical protein